MALECCEYIAPLLLGDEVAVITINAGTPDAVSGIVIYAEGCDCSYADLYEDLYCDVTEGGAVPNARITDTIYEITNIPPNHTLVIDAVDRTVKLVQTGTDNQVGGIDAIAFMGLFDWIETAKGGCQRVCFDPQAANTNPGGGGETATTVMVETVDREW